MFAFENEVYQFRVLPFGLNTAPQVFTRLGHRVAAYLHRQGILVIPYIDDWLIHHPDHQALLRHQSQLLDTLDLVGLKLNKVKSEVDPVQDIQFLGLGLHLDQGFPLNILGSGDDSMCVPNILPNSFVVQRGVPVHGITQLSLWSRPTGSVTHEALTTTIPFAMSDKPVYTTMLIRPFSPCHPTRAMAGPIFSHIRNPYPAFSSEVDDFHRLLYPGLGCPCSGFPDLGYLDPIRTQGPHHYFGAQVGNAGPPSLGFNITGPPSYDRYRQHHCCILNQQTGWDPFPPLVTAGSGIVFTISNSRYSHPGQTYSGLRKCDSGTVILAKPAHHDRVASPPQNSQPSIWDVGNSSSGHV